MTETRAELVAKLRMLDAGAELADAVRTAYGLPSSDMITVMVVVPQGFEGAKQLWSHAFVAEEKERNTDESQKGDEPRY